MKRWAAGILLLTAAPAWTQRGIWGGGDHLIGFFPDAAVEFSVETTGPTMPVSSRGSLVVNRSGMLRLVLDKDGQVIYAYSIEASRGSTQDTINIKIKPIDEKTAENYRGADLPSWPIPTVASARDFSGVKKGEAVKLEILYNPATGEKVYDVLRPASQLRPPETEAATHFDRLAFDDVTIVWNGENLPQQGGLLTGAAVRLYLPGHGAYFIATYPPQTAQPFQRTASVSGDKLDIAIDGDSIQIVSKQNILPQGAGANLWVYHDPKFQPKSHPESIAVVFATRVDYVLSDSR